jgi:hypothetical protein
VFRRALAAVAALVLAAFGAAATEPSKKHPSPCETSYPSDATIQWKCRTIRSGEPLEKMFPGHWVGVARFNRIDRRHARPGIRVKVPVRLDDLGPFQPVPLFYPPAEYDGQFILIDLSEQFLGAYEYGALRFAVPIASGNGGGETPTGEFRLTAAHRTHTSCLYTVEGTQRPYPMNYALRFFVNRTGVSYWIHGRDLPGYPASDGCIGRYDEAMQKAQYGIPRDPVLNDAKRVFVWVLGAEPEDDETIPLAHGPRVMIIGRAPQVQSDVRRPHE